MPEQLGQRQHGAMGETVHCLLSDVVFCLIGHSFFESGNEKEFANTALNPVHLSLLTSPEPRSPRMVFFICNACGDTLKKNMVDKHSWSCKGCWKLACMDCGKEFEGEAYKEHMSCISEAQRYEGKLYQPKENKGEVKQQAWTDGVQQRLQSAPGMAA